MPPEKVASSQKKRCAVRTEIKPKSQRPMQNGSTPNGTAATSVPSSYENMTFPALSDAGRFPSVAPPSLSNSNAAFGNATATAPGFGVAQGSSVPSFGVTSAAAPPAAAGLSTAPAAAQVTTPPQDPYLKAFMAFKFNEMESVLQAQKTTQDSHRKSQDDVHRSMNTTLNEAHRKTTEANQKTHEDTCERISAISDGAIKDLKTMRAARTETSRPQMDPGHEPQI